MHLTNTSRRADMKHSLTDKDTTALVAECSVCGPGAGIAKAGRGWVCREARREAQRTFRAAHPERVREWKKRPPSKHRLTKRDGTPDTCAVCGPVNPVVMGRGYGCPVRAAELGRTTFAAEPQPACPICRTYLDHLGACAKCDDDLADLDTKFLPAESRAARRLYHPEQGHLSGYTFIDLDAPHNLVDDVTSVTPHLKVIGSTAPVGKHEVRPEYAALYGSGSR